MTVASETNRFSYQGNGTTGPWAFTAYFLQNSHLKVILTNRATKAETPLVLTTDFTATGAGVLAGGHVDTVVAVSAAYDITIFRDPDLLQLAEYPRRDPFPSSSHQMVVDKLTMQGQRARDLVDRSFRLSDGDTSGISPFVANLIANALVGVNAAGTALEGKLAVDINLAVVTAYALGLMQAPDKATAQAILGARDAASDLYLAAGKVLIFEGTTDDAFETTLTVVDPTADRVISLPNADTALAGLAVAQLFTKNQRPAYTNTDTANGGGSFSYDGNTKGQVCLVTVTTAGALTFAAPANIVEGAPYTFIIKEGDALVRTYAYNVAFKNFSQMPTGGTGVSGAQSCWNFIGGPSNTLIYNVPSGS